MSIRMINPGAGNQPNPVGDGTRVNPPTVTIMTDTEVIAEIEARKQILFVTALPATGDTTHIWCLNNDELWIYSSANEWRRVNDKTHRINGTVAATYSPNNTFTYTMPANTYVRVNDFVVFDNLFCIVAARTGGSYAAGFACTLRVLTTDLSFTALYRVVADMNPVVKVFQSTTVPIPSTNPPKARVGDLLLIGAPNAEALAIITAMTTTTYTVTILSDNVTHCVIYVPNKEALPATGDDDFLYITLNDRKLWYWDKTATPAAWKTLTAAGIKVVEDLGDITLKDNETLYIVKRKTAPSAAPAEAYWWNKDTDTFVKVYDLPTDIITSFAVSNAGTPADPSGYITTPIIAIGLYSRATTNTTTDPAALMFKTNEDIVISRDVSGKTIGFTLPYYVKYEDPLPDPNATLPKDQPKENVIYWDSMHRLWTWDGDKYEQMQGKVISVEGFYPDENGNVSLHLNNHAAVNGANFDESLSILWGFGDRQNNLFEVPTFPVPVSFDISSNVNDFRIIYDAKYPDTHHYVFHYYAANSTDPDKPANVPSFYYEDRRQDGTLVDRLCLAELGFWVPGAWTPFGFEGDHGGYTSYDGTNDPASIDAFVESLTTLGLVKYNYMFYVDLSALVQKVDNHIADDDRHLTESERNKINEGLVTSVEHIPPDASGNVDLDLDNTGPMEPTIPGAIWACTYDDDRKRHKFIVTGGNQPMTIPISNCSLNFILSDDRSQTGELRFFNTGKVEFVWLNEGVIVQRQVLADNGQWIDGASVTFSGIYDSYMADNDGSQYMQNLPSTELGYQFAQIYTMAEIHDGLAAEIARATAAEQAEQVARTDKDVDLQTQIWALQNLGRFLGSVPTFADVASFTLPDGAGLRDFITVQHDETNANLSSRYILTDLGPPPEWTFDLTYQTDITGKVDKLVSNWTPGNLVRSVNDGAGNGNIEDAGFSLENITQDFETFVYGRGSYMGTYNDITALHAALDDTAEPLAKGKSWAIIKTNENGRPCIMSVINQDPGVYVDWQKDYEFPTAVVQIPNYSQRSTVASSGNNGDALQYTVPAGQGGWYQVNVEQTTGLITHLRVWINDVNVYGEYDENNGYDNIYSSLFLCWPGDVIYTRTYELNSTTVLNSSKRIYKFANR